MALLTGWPTDGADGSVSSEARWRAMARQWLGSGVLRGVYSELASAYAAGAITTQPGGVWIDGHYAELTAVANTPATANGLLVVRFTPADNKFELLFRDGVTVPTQTTATWELPIALMSAGAMVDSRPFSGPYSGSGGMTKLQDFIAQASVPNIDFPNIPPTFAHLHVVFQGRHDASGTFDFLYFRANGDNAGNYDYTDQRNTGAAVWAVAEGLAQVWARCGLVTGASATAGKPGSGELTIQNYAGAIFQKTFVGRGSTSNSISGAIIAGRWGGLWRNSNPISRLTLYPGVGNFIAGTRATLYGLS